MNNIDSNVKQEIQIAVRNMLQSVEDFNACNEGEILYAAIREGDTEPIIDEMMEFNDYFSIECLTVCNEFPEEMMEIVTEEIVKIISNLFGLSISSAAAKLEQLLDNIYNN